MLEYLPTELRKGLDLARKHGRSRRSRLCLHLGNAVFPVLRLWEDGFAIDAARLPRLRGFVEIRDGAVLVCTCLIVANRIEDGELICNFKRATPPADSAPVDYWRGEHPPAGLLPKL